jgi:hypothetical protein
LFIGSLLLSIATTAYSQTVKLHVPIVAESPLQHFFFHELLKTALLEAGHTPELIIKKYPQKRTIKQLDNGILSIYWMVASTQREKKYIPIKINLTNQLIGKRILFIKHGEQAKYDQIKTLEDFRNLNLVGGMGQNWFDAQVWKTNNLKYEEKVGNWKAIFKMIPRNHSYNYFARGINEIVSESLRYPALDIEKNLVFIYDSDFQFYLNKEGINAGKPYQILLTEALQKAQKSGLIDRLVEKYWGNNVNTLNYEQRIKIHLQI